MPENLRADSVAPDESRGSVRLLALLSGLLFLSGASSLIFEVLWTRKIALVFGCTVHSASATTAAFLLGLGLGAWLSGRYAHRLYDLLRWFITLELVIGLSALAVLWQIPHFAPLAASLSRALEDSLLIYSVVRFLLVFLTILVPCTAMGANLPLLVQFFSRAQPEGFSQGIGSMYALNTLGAASGAFLADFVLVKHLGVDATGCVALSLNLTVAALGLFLRSRVSAPDPDRQRLPQQGPHRFHSAYAVALASGAAGLLLQITWTRLLVFFNGSDVFAFSTTLVTYLVGLVLGSLLFVRLVGRSDTSLLLGKTMGFLAVSGFAPALALGWLKPLKGTLGSSALASDALADFMTAAAVILPATICLGLLFPLTSQLLYESSGEAAASVGTAYLWNTFGSVAGALLSGFVLIPRMGLQWTLVVACTIAALQGAFLLRKLPTRAVATLALPVLLFLAPADLVRRNLGVPSERIIYQGEDVYGTLSLVRVHNELGDAVQLLVDGFNMAGDDIPSRRYASMLSALPILLHDDPEEVLVICLGLANTAGAAVGLDTTASVDCVELSGEVVKALRHLPRGALLDSPKLRLHIQDGRNYLLTTRKRYDIITAEPPPPTNAGIVNLYSREYYELCRSRLRPGGIAAQWLPIFQLSPFEARTIIRAFQEVFPHCYLFEGDGLQLCLVGSEEPITLDYSAMKAKVLRNRAVLEPVGLGDPELVAAALLAGPEELRAYTAETPPLTDDRPYIQYSDRQFQPDTQWYFLSSEDRPVFPGQPADRQELEKGRRALGLFRAYLHDSRLETLSQLRLGRELLQLYPENPYFPKRLRATAENERYYRRLAELRPDQYESYFELAKIFYLQSRLDEAAVFAAKAGQKASQPGQQVYGEALLALILDTMGSRAEAHKRYADVLARIQADSGLAVFIHSQLNP
ncbi:MAG: fused MFS/spermidine synthase [Armatimonadetes bacterium]|nr:fused MFS/spermidine synthase [Armatimonadota bacterium]